jgi:arsenate reductase
MKHLIIITFMALSTIPGNGQTKKVIFVCEHGAGKSVVAAAYFNKIAKDRNLDWEASCRGTNPDEEVSAPTKEGLRSDNLLDPKLSPQKLAQGDTSNIEKIILFTKLPDDFKTTIKNEDWSSLPNIDAKYEVRRDVLIKKINEFFDSLEKQN